MMRVLLLGLMLAGTAASAQTWSALASDQVRSAVRPIGQGVCLDYDFGSVSGYAVARRELPVRWDDNAVVRMRIKARGGPNTVQLKWVDGGGDNVWWLNQPDAAIGSAWQDLRIPMRRIDFAWGPTEDKRLRETRSMELAVVAGKAGGKGSVCIDQIRWSREALPPAVLPPPVWNKARKAWDAGLVRDFSGALLRSDQAVRNYALELSEDGIRWKTVRRVAGAQGPVDALYLPEARARWLRTAGLQAASLELVDAAGAKAWRSADDALKARAALEPRGHWPRAYLNEQNFWTVFGADGMGPHSALMSEDGAVELGVAGPSLEPVLELTRRDGRIENIGWADVQSGAQLAQAELPLPQVQWQHRDFTLDIAASASGGAALVRYRFGARNPDIRSARLLLMLRPLQVNPPQQFLNTPGGVAKVGRLSVGPQSLDVDGRWRISSWPAANIRAASLDAGLLTSATQTRELKPGDSLADANGQASAVLAFDLAQTVSVRWGLRGELASASEADALEAQAIAFWQKRLGALQLDLPAADPRLARTLKMSLAHMLLSRDGAALRPGTRAYARTWIRDGAMMVSGLARIGESVVAREFVDWFAPHLFANGKVPCCIDARGSDPVAENDSHGQYIFAVAELWRLRQPGDGVDAAWLKRHWPHVRAALRYMESLRQSERLAPRLQSHGADAAFFGMMPASISHEGYSAKPMHSYWDNFWALRGYKDAVLLAQAMGDADMQTYARWRDEFATDLGRSLQRAMDVHRIGHLPGAAELGDFDATSSTVALDPAQAQDILPPGSLDATFGRYWNEAQSRAAGTRAWLDYTPYELRTVGSLLRMGQQQRAWKMLDFFFADQRPAGWLQWAEVVMREPRRTHFLGDMPHAWVSSDYLRAALDALAYERELADGSAQLVIGAGWTPAWWHAGHLRIDGLVTRFGRTDLQMAPTAQGWQLRIAGLRAGAQARLVWPEGLDLPQAWLAGTALRWDGRELPLPPAEGRAPLVLQLQRSASTSKGTP